KIVVCVKQVPDSAARVVVEDGRISWGDAPLVINPWDEYAVEAALKQKEAYGGSVTVLSMGKEDEKEAIKHALAMGCDEAILISDPTLAKADGAAAARVLAAAITKVGEVDLVFFGKQAIDSDMGTAPAMTARVLGWPALTLVSTIDQVGDGKVTVQRGTEEGRQVVSGQLPAVLSMTKDYGEPRYPSFMGIRKAARAQVPVWGLSDLGIEAPAVAVSWPEVMNPPVREITNEIITGESPQEIAEKLADRIMAEKVL
ncbi:MAG: electron transfer flavoprotein subunit beta/FixA family protein, partial [Anaerolineales bacterium]|nr:electron transfer flavoprotein subunit beta/FixA family protein [Anaerolineales bacterium]